jgi:hypothetical protein
VIGAVQNYSGIALSDVQLIRNLQAENLILSVGGQGNAIRFSNFDPSNHYDSPTAEYYQFENGEILNFERPVTRRQAPVFFC